MCGFEWTDNPAGTTYDKTVQCNTGSCSSSGVIGFGATGSDTLYCKGFGCTCTLTTICTDTSLSVGC